MKFAVLPNMTRQGAYEVTEGICSKLSSLGAKCYIDISLSGLFKNAEYCNIDAEIELTDAVIAIGGDATIIHAAKKAARCSKPVLGVNAGRLAFMAGLEGNELHLLDRLFTGEYSLDSRLMLNAEIMNGGSLVCSDYCVNDVYISSGAGPRMEGINVLLGDKLINSYLCDGILISTPTGSTAYSLSAGGSVVDPELESILLTPVCSHSLFDRPLILRPDSVLTVESASEKPLKVSLDGQDSMLLEPGCKAVVGRAKHKAEFIRIKSDNFIDILSMKLANRKDVR